MKNHEDSYKYHLGFWTEKNHEHIFFNLTKLIYTHARGHVNFWDFKLVKPLFNGALYLIYYFKKHFKPCFFILKALKDILQHFKFMNWWIGDFVYLMSRTSNICSLILKRIFMYETDVSTWVCLKSLHYGKKLLNYKTHHLSTTNCLVSASY